MQQILIVEDHPISRAGIASLLGLETDLEVCGEVGSAAEALSFCETMQPDLVLIDLNLPDRSGLELLKDLHAYYPQLRLMVITMHDEEVYGERVLKAGGRGFLSKQAHPESFVSAIRKVLADGIYVSEAFANRMLETAIGKSPDKVSVSALSDRELQVFELIGQGINTKAISAQLHISTRTVDTHRTNIREKLGLKDMIELVHFATQWAGPVRL